MKTINVKVIEEINDLKKVNPHDIVLINNRFEVVINPQEEYKEVYPLSKQNVPAWKCWKVFFEKFNNNKGVCTIYFNEEDHYLYHCRYNLEKQNEIIKPFVINRIGAPNYDYLKDKMMNLFKKVGLRDKE
ncbi:MAG: hypothetical protein WC812_03560 [Candidatus Pacearchaeota archaeon]|jgi:hypothetical protein